MTRSIHIYCDGGFGNRFNGLVAGLAIAELAGLEPVVVWPCNNWCGAAYGELIATPATVVERELSSYASDKDKFLFFTIEDHLGMGFEFKSPLQMPDLDSALDYLRASDKDVHFHTPLIPAFLAVGMVHAQVRALQFLPALKAQATAFMDRNHLVEYFGIHIRKTDFGTNGSDDTNLYQLVRDVPNKKFFVCSDDKDVEQRFGALANVVMYPKRAYVEKLVDGTWNTPTADHSGRVYACNVNRNAVSVEDAVIDLLVLSHSQIVSTSNSTFRNTALLLQTVRNAELATGATAIT
jgi:hypothetical protein